MNRFRDEIKNFIQEWAFRENYNPVKNLYTNSFYIGISINLQRNERKILLFSFIEFLPKYICFKDFRRKVITGETVGLLKISFRNFHDKAFTEGYLSNVFY